MNHDVLYQYNNAQYKYQCGFKMLFLWQICKDLAINLLDIDGDKGYDAKVMAGGDNQVCLLAQDRDNKG